MASERRSSVEAPPAKAAQKKATPARAVADPVTPNEYVLQPGRHEPSRLVPRLLLGIFLMMLISALYFAKDFFMPVVLAFLMALTLTPIVRFLRKRGVPSALSATLLVVISAATIGGIGYAMSGPVIGLVQDAPRIGRELKVRLAQMKKPLDQVVQASKQIDEATDTARDQNVQKVVVQQPGVISRAAGNLLSAGTTIAITLVLSLFLLSSGQLFYEKIVQTFPTLSDKKRALRIVHDVEREISRYLLTITIINSCLGLAVGTGLWALGMPNALVWGVAAALLNYLPYVGALTTIVIVGSISLVTFDHIGYAILAPLYVLFCNIMEGQFITPLTVGRRLELNAVAIFIAVAFWSWLWGLVGALIAVPLLVVIRVFCDNLEGLAHFGNFLSAQHEKEEDDEDERPGRAVT